jgi:hypothetical protein
MKRFVALLFLTCGLLARPAVARPQDQDEPDADSGRLSAIRVWFHGRR